MRCAADAQDLVLIYVMLAFAVGLIVGRFIPTDTPPGRGDG